MSRWKKSDIQNLSVRQEKYQVYIGIDCGVKTGIACWFSRDKKFYAIETLMIHQAMDKVRNWHNAGYRLMVRIEDARLRKWIPRQATESAERGRREGAGSVKRDASIWEGFLKEVGCSFELVAPKKNKTKVKADYFKKITGFTGKTSEHSRDAAMLVYGF